MRYVHTANGPSWQATFVKRCTRPDRPSCFRKVRFNVFRDLGVHGDCLLKFNRHISLIVHKAMTRARLILKCFLSRDRQLLFKAYCVYVRPLLEYCSAVWSPHFKFLVFKMEGVQRFFTKRLQGMWRQGYDDRLRLLNTIV